jgi:hypothetical protein
MSMNRLKVIGVFLAVGLTSVGVSTVTYCSYTLGRSQPAEAMSTEQQTPPNPNRDVAAPQRPADADKLKSLLAARADVARKEFDTRKQLLPRRQNTAAHLSESAHRLLKAELETSNTASARTAAYEAHLRRMKEFDEIAKRMVAAGTLTKTDASIAEYDRLDAEIMLERAKAGK